MKSSAQWITALVKRRADLLAQIHSEVNWRTRIILHRKLEGVVCELRAMREAQKQM